MEVGNATPVAEFNVWHDPEAAAILLTAGVPITMYGLDVFRQVVVDSAEVHRLRASGEPGTRLAGELLAHRPAHQGEPPEAEEAGGLGDAGAVCAVADPQGITTRLLPVEVSLAPGPARGQTVVDRRPRLGESEIHEGGRERALVDVALAVDADRYVKLYLETVERPLRPGLPKKGGPVSARQNFLVIVRGARSPKSRSVTGVGVHFSDRFRKVAVEKRQKTFYCSATEPDSEEPGASPDEGTRPVWCGTRRAANGFGGQTVAAAQPTQPVPRRIP